MLRIIIWLFFGAFFFFVAPLSGGYNRRQEVRPEECVPAFIGFGEKGEEHCGEYLPSLRVDERDADTLL
jgi:hypothetical protein